MPLTKVQKALYEAALRRKGLQPGKAVRQDPREFVGPIRQYPSEALHRRYDAFTPIYKKTLMPEDTYWNNRGRFQDLEDELAAAIESGRWERKNPMAHTYYRYYNDGDLPHMPGNAGMNWTPEGYNEPDAYKYYVEDYDWYRDDKGRKHSRYIGQEPRLTRLGELELEARADEMIENDYKNYLRQMYGGQIRQRPPKYGVRVWDRNTHEPLVSEYDELEDALKGLRRNRQDYGSAYLEELWPEE